MRLTYFKEILKEELEGLLVERVGSKVLSAKQLDKRLKNYLSREYNIEVNDKLITKGPNRAEWGVPQYLTAEVPSETVPEEDWNRFFRPLGYYIADKMDDVWSDYHKLKLYRFETHEVDPPKYVYHLTPKNKLLKIKSKGLVPKKSSKVYNVDDPRIYFAKNMNSVHALSGSLSDEIEEKPPFGNELAVLKVDTDKVSGKFYMDYEVKSGWSIFTRSNVPPDAIVNWDKFIEELIMLKRRS